MPDPESGDEKATKIVRYVWTAQDVLNILQRLNDEDCSAMGFDPT